MSWAVWGIGTQAVANFIWISRQSIDDRGQFQQNLSLS